MTIKLTYFDFPASRGLECRLALSVAGVPFEDVRVQRPEWQALKPTLPFGAVPVLEHDGRQVAQSNAILRYVGALHGLHPTDPWTAALHDSVMDSVEDIRHKMPGGGMLEDEKKEARLIFARGWLTRWFETVEGLVQGPFLAGDGISVADIKVYVILRAIYGGVYDHVDPAQYERFEKTRALFAAVDAHPGVRAWLSR